jgi:hypothetical protein
MNKKMKSLALMAIVCVTVYSCKDNNGNYGFIQPKPSPASTEATTIACDSTSIPNTVLKSEKGRVIVHEGHLQVQADSVMKYCIQLNELVAKFNGYSSNVDMHTITESIKTIPHNRDTNMQVSEVHDVASFNFKVPKADATKLLPQLLQLQGRVVSFKLNGNDRTQEFNSATIIDEAISSNAAAAKEEYSIEVAAENRTSKDELLYKSKFLWCEVQVEGTTYLKEIPVLRSNAHQASFAKAATRQLQGGYDVMQSIFLGILGIWPLLLVSGLVLYILMLKKKLRTASRKEN